MTKKIITCTFLLFILYAFKQARAQNPFNSLQRNLSDYVVNTDTTDRNLLVTSKAYNLFFQKKMTTYLTGASEISLAKVYATYSSENDKFNFGINFKWPRKEDEKLHTLLTPMLETNVKKGIATFYEKDEWKSDIRLGAKLTIMFRSGVITYDGLDNANSHKVNMVKKRNEALRAISKQIKTESSSYRERTSATLSKSITLMRGSAQKLKDSLENIRTALLIDGGATTKLDKKIAELETEIKQVSSLSDKPQVSIDDKFKKYTSEIAKAEVEALYEPKAYSRSSVSWISLWGFLPVTESKHFTATNYTERFTEVKFNPWELNLQLNTLVDGSVASVYCAAGLKLFQNNTALSSLMAEVDNQQYYQFPMSGADTFNTAVLKTNKAYIGNFDKFVTTNLNFLLVITAPDKKKKGGEKLVTPGISIKFEKNLGTFSAANWRFGVPLRFRGKEKPFNLEPYILWKNVNNYSDKANYKVQPTIGVNIGLPIVPLYK